MIIDDELQAQVLKEQHAAIIRRLRVLRVEAVRQGNEEESHVEADELLCALLSTLGFDDVVKRFKSIPKWYA